MAKRQPRRITEPAAEPEKQAEPARSTGLQQFVMKRTGTVEGASGKTYQAVAGKAIEAPEGEFDHLFNADGSSRYCAKK